MSEQPERRRSLAESIDALAVTGEALQRLLDGRERREREEDDRKRVEPFMVKGKTPRRLDFIDYAQAVPGLAAQFARKVPPQFWSTDEDMAAVSCPCEATPLVHVGVPLVCVCERAYLYDGQDVRVAFSPVAQASDVPVA